MSEDFITGREHAKCAGGRGVSGRVSEDFITGREHTHTKRISVGGRGRGGGGGGGLVEEGVKTLFLRGSTQK